jgi:DNA-binding CsgD family transcriptional regulator
VVNIDSGVTMTSSLELVDRDLWDVVQDLDLPLVLVDLRDFTIAYVTPAFLAQVNLPIKSVLHVPIYELYDPVDSDNARVALRSLAEGKIDYFRAHRVLRQPSTSTGAISLWVSAIDINQREFALAEVCGHLDVLDSPLSRYLGYTPLERAVGLINSGGVITAVSSNVSSVLGIAPEHLIGKQLLLSLEARRTYKQLTANKSRAAVALPLDSLDHFGANHSVRCIVTPLSHSTSHCFLLIADAPVSLSPPTDRTSQLEHHLWRIASEVQASGIFDTVGSLPDAERFPQLNHLSTREWEVLSRLLRGERVASISAALFVSSSTVRNNLSSIFKKFGVHSQSELLTLLLG